MSTSIKWRDKEVQTPYRRKLVVVYAVVMACVGIVGVLFGLFVMVPFALVLHPFLRLFGRKGTVRTEGNKWSITVDREAFGK